MNRNDKMFQLKISLNKYNLLLSKINSLFKSTNIGRNNVFNDLNFPIQVMIDLRFQLANNLDGIDVQLDSYNPNLYDYALVIFEYLYGTAILNNLNTDVSPFLTFYDLPLKDLKELTVEEVVDFENDIIETNALNSLSLVFFELIKKYQNINNVVELEYLLKQSISKLPKVYKRKYSLNELLEKF